MTESKKEASLLASLDGLNAQQLKRLLVEHLTKQKLGLYWESSSIERDAALNANIVLPRMVAELCHRPTTLGDAPNLNLIIEGDNFDSLRLLRATHAGKIRVIYIDPPYNTGSDSFIYPDRFQESKEDYLRRINDLADDGTLMREGFFRKNGKENGHYHSNWLSMMLPRLYIARNLLREDGVIFVSCDDNEVHNLRCLMNEVFGEENFIAEHVWKKSYGGGSKVKHVVVLHEYVLCYARVKERLGAIELPPDPKVLKYYKFKDEKFEVRGPFRLQPLATASMDERENLRFPIVHEGDEIWPEKQW